jgi:RHS repeat-associated protein
MNLIGAIIDLQATIHSATLAGNLSTRYGYTGREFDADLGLQYSRARFYDAKLGRFISENPIGFVGKDINLYGYVWNSPIKYIDPKGTDGEAVIGGSGLAALELVGGYISTGLSALGSYAAAAAPPVAVGVAGLGAGYAIGYYPGQAIARYRYPEQFPEAQLIPPTVSSGPARPWIIPPTISSGPSCDAKPFPTFPAPAIPFVRSPPRPFEEPEDNRDGCKEEISACVVLCAEAEGDPNRKNVWGGSRTACLQSCIPDRCKRGFKF